MMIKCSTIPATATLFPHKLFRMIEDGDCNSLTWNDDGTHVIIKTRDFVNELLSLTTLRYKYQLKTTTVTSFIRQLHAYGFRKLLENNEENIIDRNGIRRYHHPYFRKGKPELLPYMKRNPRGKDRRKPRKSNYVSSAVAKAAAEEYIQEELMAALKADVDMAIKTNSYEVLSPEKAFHMAREKSKRKRKASPHKHPSFGASQSIQQQRSRSILNRAQYALHNRSPSSNNRVRLQQPRTLPMQYAAMSMHRDPNYEIVQYMRSAFDKPKPPPVQLIKPVPIRPVAFNQPESELTISECMPKTPSISPGSSPSSPRSDSSKSDPDSPRPRSTSESSSSSNSSSSSEEPYQDEPLDLSQGKCQELSLRGPDGDSMAPPDVHNFTSFLPMPTNACLTSANQLHKYTPALQPPFPESQPLCPSMTSNSSEFEHVPPIMQPAYIAWQASTTFCTKTKKWINRRSPKVIPLPFANVETPTGPVTEDKVEDLEKDAFDKKEELDILEPGIMESLQQEMEAELGIRTRVGRITKHPTRLADYALAKRIQTAAHPQ